MLQFPIELLLCYSVGETIQSLLIRQKTSPKSLWLSSVLPCCRHYLTNHLYYTVGYLIINYSDAATTPTATISLPFEVDNKFSVFASLILNHY